MVTKVFNFQPVLFHQYYLCRLLWFKKQSFTLVRKPNPPLLSRLPAVLWLCNTQKQTRWSSRPCICTSATTSKKKITGGGGGGVVRLTAKPRYLLLLHRGNKKSNTVTALKLTLNYYQHSNYCMIKNIIIIYCKVTVEILQTNVIKHRCIACLEGARTDGNTTLIKLCSCVSQW